MMMLNTQDHVLPLQGDHQMGLEIMVVAWQLQILVVLLLLEVL
jgi:hypothetical protein